MPASPSPIPFDDLASSSSTAHSDFCERLHAHGFAVVRFSSAAATEVAALRELAAGFFSLAPEDKTAIGDFRFVGDTYAGYRDSASIDAEFLEVHTTDTNGTYPPLAKPAGLSKAAAALQLAVAMSRRMLVVLIAHQRAGGSAARASRPAEIERGGAGSQRCGQWQ